jgi:hypothetical protein
MLLIGVDDTDNRYTRGTGHRARLLAGVLAARGCGRVRGITRHQLLVDDAIPYTSHNSSACIALEDAAERSEVIRCAREFLLRESAVGSDAGLCVTDPDGAGILFGIGARAKVEVMRRDPVIEAARQAGAHLEGLTGDHGGIIGAAAAVGLHAGGEDGRYLWLPVLRDMAGTTVRAGELMDRTGLDAIRSLDGAVIEDGGEWIELGDWPRAIRNGGKAVLLVEKKDGIDGGWRTAPREIIKSLHP